MAGGPENLYMSVRFAMLRYTGSKDTSNIQFNLHCLRKQIHIIGASQHYSSATAEHTL